MHWSTGRAGSMNVAPRQEELQRPIEEKQLCEWQCHVSAAMLRQRDFEGVSAMRVRPELRIRGPPAQRRPPHGAAFQTTPPGDMGPWESVTFTITSERRRLRPRIVPKNPDSCTVVVGARSKHTQNRLSPSKEFAIRLSRLHKASAPGAATVPEAVAAAAKEGPLGDSPAISPIAAECPAGQADVSAASYLSRLSALFGDHGGVSCVGRGDVEGARHVRFSSQSPQVATFSVERCCVPLQEGFEAVAVAAAAAPGTRAGDAEKLTPDPALDLIEKAPFAPLDTAAQRVSPLAMSPFASSRYSTLLSPRTSVSSYLTQIQELRHSLLEAPSDTRRSRADCNDDTRLRARAAHDLTTTEQPLVMDRQAEREGAAPPAKQRALERTRDLGDSVGAAAVGINSTTMSGALGLAVPVTSGVAVTPVMWEASECFSENSPIFLRRPERRAGPSTQDFPEAQLLTNITNQSPKSSAPRPPRSRMSREESAMVVHKPTKKCVRFRESVERSDRGTSGTQCKRRRPGWRPAHSSASSPAVAGVPIVMPGELCCEQEGFGAGIILACGPTLYFD
ncbi:conserved hypothetical protein [Leishmania mexicana MHOM/GT/2001/U1103]|uniref:Uncharacterized protein n=1 Tax=Leishmania mexicana (strain MHOM/GT/2001/U1103) TaxID=929439 RepID=E9B2P4_LEIMU|nr:conserved hypothetical protein [Leishmania mexicana MHOM/GT/2001/U1103]CBZ29507.1 conserved hypothetical protein [Leishmania mexicana MHOM/GT/2001/U1103]